MQGLPLPVIMTTSQQDRTNNPMMKEPSIRLFVDQPFSQGAELCLDKGQAHYLLHVMRLDEGALVKVFNGRDGEWSARLLRAGKRAVQLELMAELAGQTFGPDVHYYFAPLKRARLDYMVQKAVELGAARLGPVITSHCVAGRVNLERMRANAVEAAEQCGLLFVPEIVPPQPLSRLVEGWDETRGLIFCDEAGAAGSPLDALEGLAGRPVAVLIGPEGGFSGDERSLLMGQRFVTPLSLGPRIMRADTAAVAALSLVNSVVGDWS